MVLLLVCFMGSISSRAEAGAPGYGRVEICGESAIMSSVGAAREKALENAKEKAVKKALARFLSSGDDPESLYQRIACDYQKYILSKVTIVKETVAGNKLYLISLVDVDFGKLEGDLRTAVKKEQEIVQSALCPEEKPGDTVFFFVRTTGISDLSEEHSAQAKILQNYEESFRAKGFVTANEDRTNAVLQKYEKLPYEKFISSLETDINANEQDVLLAIIGQIDVLLKNKDNIGCTFSGVVHVQGYDFVKKAIIAEYSDQYTLRCETEQEAKALILKKAAENSSKALAAQTLAYWKNFK